MVLFDDFDFDFGSMKNENAAGAILGGDPRISE